MPADFYKVLSVDVKTQSGTEYANMERYSWGERNRLSATSPTGVYRELTKYRIHGDDTIRFKPTPRWTETNSVLLTYVPVPATLLEGDGTAKDETNAKATNVDGVFGWDDWIVYDCLIKFIGGKEESDASEWQGLLAKLNNRIEEMKDRDRGEPDTVRNVDEERRQALTVRYGSV